MFGKKSDFRTLLTFVMGNSEFISPNAEFIYSYDEICSDGGTLRSEKIGRNSKIGPLFFQALFFLA